MVRDGRLSLAVAEKTMQQKTVAKEKRSAELLTKVERIDERIDQSELGGPLWRQRRMAATMEETYHEVLGAIQAEARRLRDPKCRVKARDKALGLQVLGSETRKMLALAAGLTVDEPDDPTE